MRFASRPAGGLVGIDSAEVIERKGQIGSLELGKYADILILSANPLERIENARAIDQVMKNGRT